MAIFLRTSCLIGMITWCGVSISTKAQTYVFKKQWGSFGPSLDQFSDPVDVATKDSNVYIADAALYTVKQYTFTDEGKSIHLWSKAGGFRDIYSPTALDVDSAGNVFVVESLAAEVLKFTRDGTLIKAWGNVPGTGNGSFSAPSCIAVSLQGHVYVGDLADQLIQKFDLNGKYLDEWSPTKASVSSMSGIAVDKNENVYLTDSWDNNVTKYDKHGNFITIWGDSGTANGKFHKPTGIAIAKNGTVFVSDYSNNRIQIFDSTGTYLSQFGTKGSGPGQLNGPRGICFDKQGNLYVADETNFRIQVFGPSSIVTELEERDEDNRVLTIYPNPSSTAVFYLKGLNPGDKIQVEDLQGKEVYSGLYNSDPIDLSKQSKGVYIAKLQSQGRMKHIQLLTE